MKKMSKQDVETVIFENAKTGEALEFQHEQHKAEYGAKHFWKADKKFFELLSTFSAAESKVVAYILQKTQPTKNEFIGAYKTIARKLECDVTTVRKTFKKMMENDMLAKTDDERIWMLNPRLLVKGDNIVKARLMSKYDSLLGRPLSDWIITDSNGNDPLFLPIEYPTPESLDTAKSDFIKVYHLFFETLSGLGGKEYPAVEGQDAAAVAVPEEEKVPFGETLKCLFHNKYWVMALILAICSNIFYGLSNSSGTYYCKWIYGNDNLVGILGGVGLIPTVLGFALTPVMIKKLGVTKSIRVSFVIGIAGNVLRLLNPYDFVYNSVLGCFSTFANIPMMCLLGVITAMSIDYNEYKFGKRMVGSSQAAASFGSKVGNGLGTSLIGWCLAIAAYEPTMTVLTPAVKQAIFTFNIYAPLAMFVLMFIISMKFDLEKKLPDIQKELAERKAQNK